MENRSCLLVAITVAALQLPALPALAGGELVARSGSATTTQQSRTAASTYSYRFCVPYPYSGANSYPCTNAGAWTHYTPTCSSVYPGYAYAGYGACGNAPSPFLTGGLVGLAVGAALWH